MSSTQSSSSIAPSPIISSQRSPWHSPVPYLFGGLAAMLGLIVFALFILACSYWKLSGHLNNHHDDRDLEAGDSSDHMNIIRGDCGNENTPAVFEEKYLVIMAGDVKPTFLATAVSSRTSSFGSSSCRSGLTDKSSTSEAEDDKEESSC